MPAGYLSVLGIKVDTTEAEASLKRLDGALTSTASSAEKTGASAGSTAARGIDQMERSSRAAFESMDRLSRAAYTAMGVFAGFTIGRLAGEFLQVNAQMQNLQLAFKQIEGSSEGASKSMAFVRSEAERLGLSITTAAAAYKTIAAASRDTTLEGEQTRKIFSAVTEAMARLGASSADTQGALLAIGQMISKGTVQAEELRGQLGERLPGAFQIASRSMGVTTAELGKMLEQGQVITDRFLPAFARQLEQEMGSAGGRVESFTAAVGRLGTAWNDLLTAIGNTGAFDAAATAVGALAGGINFLIDRTRGAIAGWNELLGISRKSDIHVIGDQLDMLRAKRDKLMEESKNGPNLFNWLGGRTAGQANEELDQVNSTMLTLEQRLQSLQKTQQAASSDVKVGTDAWLVYGNTLTNISGAFTSIDAGSSKTREAYIKLWREGLSPVQKAYEDLQQIKLTVGSLDATEAEKTAIVADYQAKYEKALAAANRESDRGAKAAAALAEHQQSVIDKLREQILTMDGSRESALRLEASHQRLTAAQQAEYVQLKLLIERRKEDRAMQVDLMHAQAERAGQIAATNEQVQRETAQLYMSNDERDRQNKLLASGIPLWDENYQKVDAAIQQQQKLGHQMDALRDIAASIRDGFASAFESIFTKGVASFSDLVDKIKAWFAKLLADLAMMAMAQPIMVPIMTGIASMMGVSNPAQAAQTVVGGMMPWGNMIGTGAQMAGINPLSYINWLGNASGLGYGTGFGTQQSLMLANQEAGMTGFGGVGGLGWGTVLGGIGAGLGGWGLGGMAAGWYGGNQLGGNIGGALGGVGGMFAAPTIAGALGIGGGAASGALMGSVVPVIGTIVGAILGGLLGGLFGGDQEPNHFRVSLGTGKQFPYRDTIKGYEDYTSVQGPFGDIGYLLRGNNDAFDAAAESSKKFLEGIQQIDTAFAQFLSPQEVQSVKDRLKNLNEVEFTDTFSGIEAIKQRMSAMLDAVDPQLAKLYQGLDITADNAGNVAVGLVALRKEFGSLDDQIRSLSGTSSPVQQFLNQIDALDAAMMSAAKAGQEALVAGDPAKVLAAEQNLKQAIVARYQYEMDAATQLNSVIQGLKAAIAQLQQQMYQSRVAMYQDYLGINQRINATGGGGVTQLGIYRQAGAELLGAYAGETDPARRLEMLKQGVDIVDQALAARMAEIDQWAQAQQADRQKQIDSLNQQKTAIQATAQARIDALAKERTVIQSAAQARVDALNKELQSAQAMAQLLPGIRSALDAMRYGGTNPLSSFARLQLAQSDLGATTDPSRRLQLLQTIMGLGGEAYQRPSGQYQDIYNRVAHELSGMQDQAQDAANRAAQLQEQIASASDEMNASLKRIDDQITAVNDSAAQQAKGVDAQIAALSDMTDIQAKVKAMQAEANAEANSYYLFIRNEGSKAYEAIQSGLADQIAANQAALGIAQDQMNALTANLGYTAFIAERNAEMVALLTDIKNVLAGIYSGRVTTTQVTRISPEDIRNLIPLIRRELRVA